MSWMDALPEADRTGSNAQDGFDPKDYLPSWISPTSPLGRQLLREFTSKWRAEYYEERLEKLTGQVALKRVKAYLLSVLGDEYSDDIMMSLTRAKAAHLDGRISDNQASLIADLGQDAGLRNRLRDFGFYTLTEARRETERLREQGVQNVSVSDFMRGWDSKRQFLDSPSQVQTADLESGQGGFTIRDDLEGRTSSGGSVANMPSGRYERPSGSTSSGGTTSRDASGMPSGRYQGPGAPVLRRGDRSNFVKQIQEWLNANGFNAGPEDSIFGPKTEAAVRAFQSAAGIASDGVVGLVTRGEMQNWSGTSGDGGGGGGGDRNTQGANNGSPNAGGPNDQYAIANGQSWNNIPPDGEVWKVGNTYAVAYKTARGGPYVYYTFADSDHLNMAFPGGVPEPRKLTQREANRLGALKMGSAYLLTSEYDESWDEGFNAMLKREASANPWMNDGEVLAVMLSAHLEGRTPTNAELESTEYFSSRTDQEIQYIVDTSLMSRDERRQYHMTNRNMVRSMLIEAGVRQPPNSLVNFIADKWTTGQWNEAKTIRQVAAVSNPFSSFQMDNTLKSFVKDLELSTLAGATERTKQLVKDWLGPNHGGSYSDEWYRQWAGAVMDDPNAENDLVSYLQQQRLALYPEYENANLKYADIAPVWENLMTQTWGITPSSQQDWNVLDRVIRTNDATEASRLLRQEGLALGVEQVTEDALSGMMGAFGGQVVNS